MKAPAKEKAAGPRAAARLAAVQALYEMDIACAKADPVLVEFMQSRWTSSPDGSGLPPPDASFLGELVRGVEGRLEEIDVLIGDALSENWPMDRLEAVLKAILRAGAYELLALDEVPAKVVINEYVDLAHAFFAGKETGLVNAVLDHLARSLRKAEIGEDDVNGQGEGNGKSQ